MPARIAATLALAAGLAGAAAAATATIDLADVRQTIRGFGGATVFQPPGLPASLTAQELDTLFGNGPGQIGFTILRIRVSTTDSWRAIELEHARQARARGAIVMATPWSPPASMKSNNSLVSGHLLPANYAAYATYLNDFGRYMAENGAPLHAISVQNEPDIVVDYESCDWTPQQMLEFCRDHAGAITATRVMAPESFQFRRSMSDPILNDEQAIANVDIIGGHIYGEGLADYPLARSRGREVWMTEHLELTTDWAGALATGKEIHDCLAVANFNAYLWWYLRRYYGPLGEDGVVTKRGHVMAQFSKFIRPGFMRVGAAPSPSVNVHVSAYKGDKLAVVAINLGNVPATQTFAVQSGTVVAVTPWVTSETLDLSEQAALPVSGGTFTATLPARSITTFVGDLLFAAPVITTTPRSLSIATGDTVVLGVQVAGEFPTYQWNQDGVPIAGATERLLAIEGVQATDAGSYTVTVSNSGGSVTSAGAAITVADTNEPGKLVNISTRSWVGTGNNVQIAGFVVGGTTARTVVIRASGPALEAFGIDGVLADPVIELHDQASGAVIATAEGWDESLLSHFSAVYAFQWMDGSRDAALVTTLEPGAYTVVVRGKDGGTGVALVEVFERQ